MEQFIERLDTVLDSDPFHDIDWSLLSPGDCKLLENYRVKYLDDRKRIREERKTKSFEEIMEDLLQELSHKPDIPTFCRTLDDPLLNTHSARNDIHKIASDTSDDEQDDLEHFSTWIDPSKSIGHSIANEEVPVAAAVVHPSRKSPTFVPPSARKPLRYAGQPRRNTYTLLTSSSEDEAANTKSLVNTKPDYVRLNSQGFDPQQPSDNPFNNVTDARSTFSIPRKEVRLTHQEAQRVLREKLGAFIKGHLTRKLFHTDHVRGLLQTLQDTQRFAIDFQSQCLQTKTKLDPEDINIIDQLIKQVELVLNEIHAIFGQNSPAQQMAMIAQHDRSHQLRAIRTHQRIAKDFSVERPIIDPLPTSSAKAANGAKQADYRRPANVRRHVSAAPTRSAASATSARPQPAKKATSSVQRPSRPSTVLHNDSAGNPPRSSSANNNHPNNTNSNNNIFRPPLRLAPASPMFRNRFK